MSSGDIKSKKRSSTEVRKIIAKVIAESLPIRFSQHALDRMEERNVSTLDVHNVLRATNLRVSEAEPKGQSWTYRCSTNKFWVAIAINYDAKGLVVVTVARVERK